MNENYLEDLVVNETATGVLRPNWWRMVLTMMMIKYKDQMNKTSYERVT